MPCEFSSPSVNDMLLTEPRKWLVDMRVSWHKHPNQNEKPKYLSITTHAYVM